MPRKTRAAAKAEGAIVADVPIQEIVSTDLQSPEESKCEQLRSITPNSAESLEHKQAGVEEEDTGKGTKGEKKAPNKKGKKKTAKLDAGVESSNPEDVDPAVREEVNGEDLSMSIEQKTQTIVDVQEPIEFQEAITTPETHSPPVSSTERSSRKTRRQVTAEEAKENDPQEEFGDSILEHIIQEQEAVTKLDSHISELKAVSGELMLSPPFSTAEHGNGLSSYRFSTSSQDPSLQPSEAESPSAEENLEVSSSEARPLDSAASNAPSMALQDDPVAATDALEDEQEEVTKTITDPNSPSSPSNKIDTSANKGRINTQVAPNRLNSVGNGRSKPPTGTRPSTNARSQALADSKKLASNSLSRSASGKNARPVSLIGVKPKSLRDNQQESENKSSEASAAKCRPISVHFPAPPPPAKSRKPLTTSTFTLPGDAVAAKLKAARLERQKRDEEEAAKKREIKARPTSNVKTRPVELKQKNASRARQSILGNVKTGTAEIGGLKRSATVTGATTTAANKRASVVAATRSSGVVKPPKSSAATNVVANTALKRSSVLVPRPISDVASTKPRVVSSNASKNQANSSSSGPGHSRSVSISDQAVHRLKGRAVYNRDKVEKDAREKAQKTKDDAVKRARAEAAERGRQASREWAEKHKKAKSGATAVGPTAETAVVSKNC